MRFALDSATYGTVSIMVLQRVANPLAEHSVCRFDPGLFRQSERTTNRTFVLFRGKDVTWMRLIQWYTSGFE